MTTTGSQSAGIGRTNGWRDAGRSLELDGHLLLMAAALAAIWIAVDLITGGLFLTPRNLWNLAVQSSVVGICATGMVFVIVARQIDLSIGSVVGFTGIVMAVLQTRYLPAGTNWAWFVTLAAGVSLGAIIGAFQGWWTSYRNVPSFIVTLGGLLIFRGLAWSVSEGGTIAPLDPLFQRLGGGLDGAIGAKWSWVLGLLGMAFVLVRAVMRRRSRSRYGFQLRPLAAEIAVTGITLLLIAGFVLVMNAYLQPKTNIPQGIPIPVLILILTIVAMALVARVTRFGRHIYAIGGNPEAANLAGIPTKRMILLILALMGALAGLAGAVATARLNAGVNSTGTLLELQVIAAAVIGGTALAGGSGTITGAILGALIIQSLQSSMALLNVPSPLQNVVLGLVLIGAVWVGTLHQRRS